MDVCAKLRRVLGERRIGHAGTLDPMATGVLPVFVGRATRAVEFASEGEKEYLAGLRLGQVTDTQDTTGTVLETHPVDVTPEALEAALEPFRGDIQQIPPMYSAIKIQGKKLYELARKGREVERPPRNITIHSLTVEEQVSGTDFLLRARCSKGTYVRTLCHDIGQALGCGGTMFSLRRTMAAAGPCSPCAGPWPPGLLWRSPIPCRRFWSTRTRPPCSFLWTPTFPGGRSCASALRRKKRCATACPSPCPAQRTGSTGYTAPQGNFCP